MVTSIELEIVPSFLADLIESIKDMTSTKIAFIGCSWLACCNLSRLGAQAGVYAISKNGVFTNSDFKSYLVEWVKMPNTVRGSELLRPILHYDESQILISVFPVCVCHELIETELKQLQDSFSYNICGHFVGNCT